MAIKYKDDLTYVEKLLIVYLENLRVAVWRSSLYWEPSLICE